MPVPVSKIKFDSDGYPIPQKVVAEPSVKFDDEGLPIPLKKKETSPTTGIVSVNGTKTTATPPLSSATSNEPLYVKSAEVLQQEKLQKGSLEKIADIAENQVQRQMDLVSAAAPTMFPLQSAQSKKQAVLSGDSDAIVDVVKTEQDQLKKARENINAQKFEATKDVSALYSLDYAKKKAESDLGYQAQLDAINATQVDVLKTGISALDKVYGNKLLISEDKSPTIQNQLGDELRKKKAKIGGDPSYSDQHTIADVIKNRTVPANVLPTPESLGGTEKSPTDRLSNTQQSVFDENKIEKNNVIEKTGQALEFENRATIIGAAVQQKKQEANNLDSHPIVRQFINATPEEKQKLQSDPVVQSAIQAHQDLISLQTQSNNLINQYPEVKAEAQSQLVANTFADYLRRARKGEFGIAEQLKSERGLFSGTGLNDDYEIKRVAELSGLSEDEVRQHARDASLPSYLGLAIGGFTSVLKDTQQGLNRLVLSKADADIQNKIIEETKYHAPASQQLTANNINPDSILSTMFTGVGQIAAYGLEGYIGGEVLGAATGLTEAANVARADLAAVNLGEQILPANRLADMMVNLKMAATPEEALGNIVAASNKAKNIGGTFGSMYATSYEQYYQEAAKFTTDESKRKQFASSMATATGLAFTVLNPAGLIEKGLTNPTGETIAKDFLETGALPTAKDVFKEKLADISKTVGLGTAQSLIPVINESLAKSQIFDYHTSTSEFLNQALNAGMNMAVAVLPLGVLGASKIPSSEYSKELLFESGKQPDLLKSNIDNSFIIGDITNEERNKQISVVNTLSQLVKAVPEKNNEGKNLSQQEKNSLVYLQLQHDALIKKKENVTESLKPSYDKEIKIHQNAINDIMGLKEEIKPQEKPTTTTIEEPLLNEAKGDIEKRRQFQIDTIEATDEDSILGAGRFTTIKLDYQGNRTKYIDENINAATKEEAINQINDKYDKQLSKLTIEEPLLNQIQEKGLSDTEKNFDEQYFIDKAGEDPIAFEERFGKKITDKAIEQVPTEKLKENRDFLAKINEDQPSVKYLDEVISGREKEFQQKPDSSITVIKPEENKAHDIIPLKKPDETVTQEPIKTNEPIPAETPQPATGEPNQTGEATGGGIEKPPISEPPKGGAFVERPSTQLSYRGLQDVANEFSLPDVNVRDRKSDIQLRQDARETTDRWAEAGQYAKNVEKLVEKAEGGEILNDEQRVILQQHLANVKEEARKISDKNSPEYDIKLAEIKRLKDAGQTTRGEAGAALRVPTGGSQPKDMEDFFVEEMDATGVSKLTEKQKEVNTKEFNDISEAKKKFDEYMAAKEAEFAAKQASGSFEKQKAATKRTKKTHEEHVEYRKKVLEDIRDKLKKAREETSVTIVPYAKELFAIAPDVAKLVKDLLEEGISKLDDVITNIHDQLKDHIPDIKKEDVNDLIAGNYNQRKPTRSELAEQAMNLKIQANLINKLDALEKGEEPKSEKKKIQRNKEITDLRNRIKDVEGKKTAEVNRIKAEEKAVEKAKSDAIKEEEKFIREFEKEKDSEAKKAAKAKLDAAKKLAADLEKKTKSETVLQSLKTRMTNEIKEIEQQIKTGNFEKAAVPAKQPIPLDKEAIDLRDKLIQLRQKRELRLLHQQRQNEGGGARALRLTAEIANVPRTLMTILDFSGLLRQNLFFSVGHPLMTSKALPGMFKSFTSKKVYDSWFADLKESPRYEMIKESKLAIADPISHDLSKREEAFMSTLAEKIPLIGQTLKVGGKTVIPGTNVVKGSERSYTYLLNKVRVDMFNYFADSMIDRGVTIKNSPKVYKAMAEYINNATGRSDFGETLNRVAPILNSVFFSPRLIASRVNMLTYWAQPRFWKTLPREVKVDYFRNWISLLAVGGSILALAKMGGADVEDDPRSTDFGKIKSGNTRWDIWGGAQPYVRAMAQIISGKRKSSTNDKIYNMTNKERFINTPVDFLRNKLAPVPGSAIDIASGETSIGDKIVYVWDTDKNKQVSIREYTQDRIIPMTITGTIEAMKDQGVKSLFTVGVPNVFGVSTQTYETKKHK